MIIGLTDLVLHDDVMKWKHFPRNCPFVRGIHRSHSPHKGQWRGALMFSLICVWIKDWVNNREAGDLRRCRGHYDVIVMYVSTNHCLDTCNHILGEAMHNVYQYINMLNLNDIWQKVPPGDVTRIRTRTVCSSYWFITGSKSHFFHMISLWDIL